MRICRGWPLLLQAIKSAHQPHAHAPTAAHGHGIVTLQVSLGCGQARMEPSEQHQQRQH